MPVMGRMSGRRFNAGFDSPANYTPAPAGSEATNKISAHLKGIDNAIGGLTSPGGADTNVQYNDAAAFGGDANFTYLKGSATLNVLGTIGVDGTGTRTLYVGKRSNDNSDSAGFTFQAVSGVLYVDFKTTAASDKVIFRSGNGAQYGYTTQWAQYQANTNTLLLGVGNTVDKGGINLLQLKRDGHNYLAIDTADISQQSGVQLFTGGVSKWIIYVPGNSNHLAFYSSVTTAGAKLFLTNWGGLGIGGVSPAYTLHTRYMTGTTTYQSFDSNAASYNITYFAHNGVIKYQLGRTSADDMFFYNSVAVGYLWWVSHLNLNVHFGNPPRAGVGFISTEWSMGFYEQASDIGASTGYGQIHCKTDHHLYFRGSDGNSVRLDGYFVALTEYHEDDTSPTTNVTVGELTAIAFPGAADSITHVEFTTDERLDYTEGDIFFEIIYSMSSAEASKQVSLNADIWVFGDNENPSKAATIAGLEDELSTPSTGNTDKIVLTNIKIPAANLSGFGQRIKIKLWRDVSGVASNHTGDFQLISMRAYQ